MKGELLVVRLKLVLTAVFWGGTFIAGRVVAENLSPFLAAFLRFAVASLILLLFVNSRFGRLPRLNWKQFVQVSLLGLSGIFAYNVFFFKGLHTVSAGRAALIIANNPVFISVFSALIFREKFNRYKIPGLLLSLSGAVLVISRGNLRMLFEEGISSGDLFILACVATWVVYSLLGKKVMTGLSPLIAVTYACWLGTLFLAPVAWWQAGTAALLRINPAQWLSLFYLGFFGTVLGFIWYYQGIQRLGPMKASVFINLVPVSAVILAFFILGEKLTVTLLLGAVLVTAGIYLTNFQRN